MENLSHSRQPNMISKRSCTDTNKSIYHDVFGGPPKFGAPTLSPRVDDYNEIFGGFRNSRASSIPVLDLPLVDEAAEIFFDVRSSGFDYGEVFGGFDGHDFAVVSYEELLMMEQSNGYSDSSDEAWTPAEAENLSEMSDRSAKDHCLSNGDSFESIDGGMEFNVSYNKAGQKINGNLPNRTTHVTQLHDVSEYTFVVDKTSSLPNTDYLYENLLESDDRFGIDYSGEMTRDRHLRKVMSYPAKGSTDGLLFGNDFKPHKEFVRNGSLPNEMFVTISDVSLKTQPSHLPPPFRPPPTLDAKKGSAVEAHPNCESVDSEENSGDSSPRYFDVEVDASSSASTSAAAIKEAMEKAQAKLKSAKKSMGRKRENFQTRAKSGSENDRKEKQEKVAKIVNGPSSRKDEGGPDISHREENGMEFSILEKQKVQKTSQLISDSLEGKKHLYVAKKSAEENHGRESLLSQGSDTIDETGEWKEATQFFELVTNRSRKAYDQENNENILVHDSDFHEHGKKEKKATVEALQHLQENAKKVKVVRADLELKEYGKKSEVSKETFELDKSSGRSEVANRLRGVHKKVQLAQDVSRQEGNEKIFSIDLKPVENEEQTRADELLMHENHVEVQHKEHKFVAKQRSHKEKGSQPKEDSRSMQDVKKFTCEKEDGERRQRRAFELEEIEKKPNITLEQGENERKLKKAPGQEGKLKMIKAVFEKEENEMLRGSYETRENEKRLRETLEQEENGRRLEEAFEKEQNERRLKEMHGREERLKRKSKAAELEEKEKKQRESHEREENEKRRREAQEREENEKRLLKQALEKEENEKKLRESCEKEENEKRLRETSEREENEKRLKEALEKEENQRRLKETLEKEKRQRETAELEENAKREREAYEKEENEKRLKEALKKEDERRSKVDFEREENERSLKEAYEREENENKQREACEKRCKDALERDGIEQRIKEARVREAGKRLEEVGKTQENCITSREAQEEDHEAKEIGDASQVAWKREVTETKHMDTIKSGKQKGINKMGEDHNVSNQSCKLDDDKNPGATQSTGMQGGSEILEAANEIDSKETSKRSTVQRNGGDIALGILQGNLDHEKSRFIMKNMIGTEQKAIENVRNTFRGIDSDVGNQGNKFANEKSEKGKDIEQAQSSFNQKKDKDDFLSARAVQESVEMGRKTEGAQPAVLEVKGNTHRTTHQVNASQSSERKMKNSYEILSSIDKEAERLKRERDLEMERLRKIEEEREREREREKDRMAVDRAILETREKVYAEARERSDRAAVERVTAEARQRALNEARERLEKACAEAREKSFPDKASTEARLRAERAAVERATAEARERAFEKAMAERATFEAKERVERSVSDKFSASSRNGGMRPSFSSSDLQDMQSQGTGSFSGSGYQYSSAYGERFEGVEGESAQRCKARLERHQRTAERAAKALAEKNMRDLLAQREQAERNRLAETLDADVKRWSSGKEGNLRALLSTLQYILGSDSGWHPIPLTEVITSAAVKKAYRKATLCVHPDKVQQRRASIQQKYICEKVFDLLKEAWNKFNSEER